VTGPRDILDTPAAGGLVVRGGTVRAVGFAAATMVSLGAVVLLTRHLGVAGYGRYQTVVSIVAIVQIVADAGLGTLGLRELSQRRAPAERDAFLRALLGLRLVLTTTTVALAAAVLAAAGEGQLAAGTALMGAGLLAALAQTTYALPLMVELRLATTTLLDTGRQALFALTLAGLVLAGAGLVPIFAATIPAGLVVLAVTVALVRGRVPARPTLRPAALMSVVRPAVPVALATTAGVVYLYAVQLLTAAVATPQENGVFAIAFRVFVVAASAPAVLVTTAFPVLVRAASDDAERFVAAITQLLQAMLLLGCGVAVVTIVGASSIVEIAGGADYAAAADVLRVQGGVLAISFLLPVLGFALLAQERHRALLAANVCGLGAMLLATPLLIDADGARGAAWAQLAGESVLFAGYALGLRLRSSGALVRAALGSLRVAACGTAGLAVGLVLLDGAPTGVASVATGASYGVLALGCGAVPAGLRDLVRPRAL
jgi:O-antigen/teichoic acid export membrane protein